jgi:SAM-dependent methyltransferase
VSTVNPIARPAVAGEGCPVCGSRDFAAPGSLQGPDRLEATPGWFSVLVCAGCGAGRTLPRVSDEELGAYYTSDYHAHAVERGALFQLAWRLGQWRRWRRVLGRWPFGGLTSGKPGRALDIGCGRGDFGAALIARGWTVVGIDPSPSAVAAARARGLDARVGFLDTVEFGEETFDAVSMLHALEHVSDPVAVLRRARELLRPGAVLVLELPNFDCWSRRRMGSHWFHLDLPRHRTHFTPEALRRALDAADFVAVDVRDAADRAALVGTLQYRWFGGVVLRSGWGSAAWQALAVVLGPVTALLDRVGGGRDFLRASARRPGA